MPFHRFWLEERLKRKARESVADLMRERRLDEAAARARLYERSSFAEKHPPRGDKAA